MDKGRFYERTTHLKLLSGDENNSKICQKVLYSIQGQYGNAYLNIFKTKKLGGESYVNF